MAIFFASGHISRLSSLESEQKHIYSDITVYARSLNYVVGFETVSLK